VSRWTFESWTDFEIEVKDKTFHGTRMYEKTKEILESKK